MTIYLLYNITQPFKELVKKICDYSYMRIDEWLTRVREVLAIELGIDIEVAKDDAKFSELVDAEVKRRCAADPKNARTKKISGLAMDLSYCKRMRELETAEKTDSLDIVPISGLVYSRITRLENEALTVINIWGKQDKK